MWCLLMKHMCIIIFFTSFVPDAKDLAGLLSVPGVSGEDHQESTHVWPSPESSAHHTAPAHLALIPALRPEPALAGDCHQSIPPLPQGQNNGLFKSLHTVAHIQLHHSILYYTILWLSHVHHAHCLAFGSMWSLIYVLHGYLVAFFRM